MEFVNKKADDVLLEEKTASYQPIIIFSEEELFISQPTHQIRLSTKYDSLGFFSSNELKKVIGNKANMVTFTKTFLFSAI